MSAKEFWEDDPDLFWAYRFSYINKKKQEQEEANVNCWLQGAYFYEAISVALSNAFSKQQTQYRDQPFDLSGTSKVKKQNPKQNSLEIQLKERAKKIEEMLGGNK